MITLEQCNDSKLIHAYLDRIDLKGTAIIRLSYVPPDQYPYDKKDMAFAYTGLDRIVNVYHWSFYPANHQTDDELLCTIIDHEGIHAQQMLEGKLVPEGESSFDCWTEWFIWKWNMELEACNNQLENPFRRQLSENYLGMVKRSIEYHEEKIKHLRKNSVCSDGCSCHIKPKKI